MKRFVLLALTLCGSCLLTVCTGGGSHVIVVVTVRPASATVPLSGGQTFAATVTGSTIVTVTWSVKEGAAGGSIDNQGNYTAPQVAGTYHVIATSVADPTKSGSAIITVPVAVSVFPSPATVFLGAMQTFTANVAGTNNMAVTWTIQEGAAGGSITSAGVYTAPQVPGIYHVIATSVVDTTQSATVTINVPPFTVTVSPNPAIVFLGAMQAFTATVTATNTKVTWAVQEGAAGGSITSAGVYTAPQVPGTYHVIATSMADATKSGSTTVTVPPVTVTVSPNPATVSQGAMRTFTATVTATNMAVTWTIEEGAAGGSITSAGVYTAPQVAGTYHVIATSVADATKSGSTTVTVPPVAISISPTADTLGPSGQRTFVAPVTGTINTTVVWSVEEGGAGGSVVNGHYTAPPGQGTFHVVATSAADPTKSATATVTVVASGFVPTGSMTVPRFGHTATLLNTGEALVAGGIAGFMPILRGTLVCVGVKTDRADLFDPTTGTFAATGAMTTSRSGHTATLLQNNKVLVAGGSSATTAEIFDPGTAAFTATGNMLSIRFGHTATLLPSGKVLLAGGQNAGLTAELFDPAMGTFAATGSMTVARTFHTATLLQSGKVLVAGGGDASGTVLSTAELYDPAAGTFTATGSMGTRRISHTATLLPNGAVLIAGGRNDQTGDLASAEIYDPMSGTFAATSSMIATHAEHTAALLPSGKALVGGGGNYVAELFDPGTGTFSQTGSMFISRTLHAAALLLPSGQVVVTGTQTPVQLVRNFCVGGTDASAELYH